MNHAAVGWIASTFFLGGILVGLGTGVWFFVTFILHEDGE